jgi:hypothetical protein
MNVWFIFVAICAFSFLIFRTRKALRLSNKIKRQLRIKDDNLLITKSAETKAKQTNNLGAIQNIKDLNKLLLNSFLLWVLLIFLILVGTFIIGVSG